MDSGSFPEAPRSVAPARSRLDLYGFAGVKHFSQRVDLICRLSNGDHLVAYEKVDVATGR
jgi:hypothetical protein